MAGGLLNFSFRRAVDGYGTKLTQNADCGELVPGMIMASLCWRNYHEDIAPLSLGYGGIPVYR